MRLKFMTLGAAAILLSACNSPNHYDSHADVEKSGSHAEAAHDTIQGRAPDSTNVIRDSSNVGIGDTSLDQTH